MNQGHNRIEGGVPRFKNCILGRPVSILNNIITFITEKKQLIQLLSRALRQGRPEDLQRCTFLVKGEGVGPKIVL